MECDFFNGVFNKLLDVIGGFLLRAHVCFSQQIGVQLQQR